MLESASVSPVVQTLAEVGDVWLGIGDVYLESLYLQGVEVEAPQVDIPLELLYEDSELDIQF